MGQVNGLALAGGGTRAFAHIGVLEVIDRMGLQLDAISGTSMGSAMGALYAAGCALPDLLGFCLELEERAFPRATFPLTGERPFFLPKLIGKQDGLVDSAVIEGMLAERFAQLGCTTMSQLKIPMAIASVDIVHGELVLFVSDKTPFAELTHVAVYDDVPIALAVRASCSFPLVFSTTPFDGRQLVDGGVMLNAPVWPLRTMGADRVLASMMFAGQRKSGAYENLYQVSMRAIDLLATTLTRTAVEGADLVIFTDVEDIPVFARRDGMEAYIRGYREADRCQELLHALLEKSS